MNTQKLNSYGALLRFITPVLVTIILFILGMIRSDIIDVKVKFDNHLQHHTTLEVKLENRLSRIETLLNKR